MMIRNYLANISLVFGFGSWSAFELVKGVSQFCQLILPILSVISFLIYILLNRFKISDSLKERRKKIIQKKKEKKVCRSAGRRPPDQDIYIKNNIIK